MIKKCFILFLLCASITQAADYTFIIVDNKFYPVTIGADRIPVVSKTPVTVELIYMTGRPTNPNPQPPTNPNPPTTPTEPTDPFELKVAQLTEQVIKNGGTKTTAAGLSSAYSIVADNILSGDIPFADGLLILPLVTNRVLKDQPDKDKWTSFKTDLSKTLQTLQQEGHLSTPQKFHDALKSVCKGMNYVSGFNGDVKKPAELKSAKSAGILGNIDIERLIEIIKFIMELIKLFSGGI